MPYPYEEKRLLVQAVLRVLSAEHGQAHDPPAEAEYADDMLEATAVAFADAVARYHREQARQCDSAAGIRD